MACDTSSKESWLASEVMCCCRLRALPSEREANPDSEREGTRAARNHDQHATALSLNHMRFSLYLYVVYGNASIW